MHIEPDVTRLADDGLTRVQSYTDPRRRVSERLLRRSGCRDRVTRSFESDKERIAGRVHLDTSMHGPDLTEPRMMVRQHLGVLRAELRQQPCRTFDIREQERDRPARQVAAHNAILRPDEASRQSAEPASSSRLSGGVVEHVQGEGTGAGTGASLVARASTAAATAPASSVRQQIRRISRKPLTNAAFATAVRRLSPWPARSPEELTAAAIDLPGWPAAA